MTTDPFKAQQNQMRDYLNRIDRLERWHGGGARNPSSVPGYVIRPTHTIPPPSPLSDGIWQWRAGTNVPAGWTIAPVALQAAFVWSASRVYLNYVDGVGQYGAFQTIVPGLLGQQFTFLSRCSPTSANTMHPNSPSLSFNALDAPTLPAWGSLGFLQMLAYLSRGATYGDSNQAYGVGGLLSPALTDELFAAATFDGATGQCHLYAATAEGATSDTGLDSASFASITSREQIVFYGDSAALSYYGRFSAVLTPAEIQDKWRLMGWAH